MTFPQLNPAYALPAPAPRKRRWRGFVVLILLATGGPVTWAGISQYDDLLYYDARIDLSWNSVTNQYTRRLELVPNLVAVVQSHAVHESELFNQIAATQAGLSKLSAATGNSADLRSAEQFQAAQTQLSAQLSRLLSVAQKYPELKSTALYQDLMVQLEGSENRLAWARQQYLMSVADYNLGLRRFPANLIANQAGLRHRPSIVIADEAALRPPLALEL